MVMHYERLTENSRRALKAIFENSAIDGAQLKRNLRLQDTQQLIDAVNPLIEHHYVDHVGTSSMAGDGILRAAFYVKTSAVPYVRHKLKEQPPKFGPA